MIAIDIKASNFDHNYKERWVHYCKEKNIDFISVNIYDSKIVEILIDQSVDILLLHLPMYDYKTYLISKSIIYSIEKAGIEVFPNFNSFWHFDDKLSQKYIFESLRIPHAKMHVFYNKSDAKGWLSKSNYPVVFKLRGGGAGSNVSLMRNLEEGKKNVRKMFRKGIKPVASTLGDLKTKMRKHSKKRDWLDTLKRFPSIFLKNIITNRELQREKGYFLIQEFMPNNLFDTRIFVIGEKAFAFRRYVRPNDFRASGGGQFDYNQKEIDPRIIDLAFRASQKIGSQSMAYDILYDQDNNPVIIEMSYSMWLSAGKTGGYWDSSLIFHPGIFWPEDAILESCLEKNRK